MKLHILSPTTINRIAAGEVIERPASAVKELVENAIDAGSTKIDVVINNGGRNFISVTDDGKGMSSDDLELCIERHATSKLSDDDLFDINFLGFRGEALPSIGSIARMSITSRQRGSSDAWILKIDGGDKSPIQPASLSGGTKIEVRDLFFATPVRLKFLKTERTETLYIQDVIEKLAMAYPEVSFTLKDEKKTLVNTNQDGDLLSRLSDIIGKDFGANSIPLAVEREGVKLSGYIGLPTFNKGSAASQYLFVNKRPVKDKFLMGVIRVAYQDFLARERYPVVALFLELENGEVDVNVHPTKAEVRFRDQGIIRGMIIGALKASLSTAGHRASTTVSQAALNSFTPPKANVAHFPRPAFSAVSQGFPDYFPAPVEETSLSDKEVADFKLPSFHNNNASQQLFDGEITSLSMRPQNTFENELEPPRNNNPLGIARCQLHGTYIVSQTATGIVIVDQHAAHERLVYERMKESLAKSGVKTQRLLIPEIVELDALEIDRLMEKQADLKALGLVIEKFGNNAIIVRETPALLGEVDAQGLIKNLANDMEEYGEILSIQEGLEHVCGTMACHSSVRAGRQLNTHEMNTILREMEATPYSGQCNHGRPTYVELKLHDIEKLFGRK
jgi:DNA mismatch repair protein MutL